MAEDTETLENTQPYESPRRIIGDAQSALLTISSEDPAYKPLQKAVDLLAGYDGLGSPEDILKAFRAAEVMDSYIRGLPVPIKEAWIAYLREKKAL